MVIESLERIAPRGYQLDPSCVLYLPLYKMEFGLAGDGKYYHMSHDHYGHLVQNEGTLWTPQGRTFDGTDDKITFPDTGFPAGAADRTILMWVKLDTVTKANQEFFFYGTAANNRGILFSATSGDGSRLQVGKYGANSGASPIGTLELNTWSQIGFTLSGGVNIAFIKNGDFIGTTTLAGIDTLLTGTSGKLGVGWNLSFIDGVCGEVGFWGRAFSLLEAQQNYLSTKWRYGR